MNKDKKWKKFEDKTYVVIKDLNPKAEVLKNVRLLGKLTKWKRQVDVKLVEPDNYDFIAFECKDYKRPIDVMRVEALNTKLKDIGAKKGAIVANSPFSKPAQNLAENLNIDLLNLVDSSDKNIRSRLKAKMLLSDIMARRIRLGGNFKSGFVIDKDLLNIEPNKVFIVNSRGIAQNAMKIFAELWNNNSSLSRRVGNWRYALPAGSFQKVITDKGQEMPFDSVGFVYQVEKRLFVGDIDIIKTKGLYNVKKRTYQTKEMFTQTITPYKAEQEWDEITGEKISEIEGQLTLALGVVSLFPIDKFKNKIKVD